MILSHICPLFLLLPRCIQAKGDQAKDVYYTDLDPVTALRKLDADLRAGKLPNGSGGFFKADADGFLMEAAYLTGDALLSQSGTSVGFHLNHACALKRVNNRRGVRAMSIWVLDGYSGKVSDFCELGRRRAGGGGTHPPP